MQKADSSPNSSDIEAGNLGQAKRIYQMLKANFKDGRYALETGDWEQAKRFYQDAKERALAIIEANVDPELLFGKGESPELYKTEAEIALLLADWHEATSRRLAKGALRCQLDDWGFGSGKEELPEDCARKLHEFMQSCHDIDHLPPEFIRAFASQIQQCFMHWGIIEATETYGYQYLVLLKFRDILLNHIECKFTESGDMPENELHRLCQAAVALNNRVEITTPESQEWDLLLPEEKEFMLALAEAKHNKKIKRKLKRVCNSLNIDTTAGLKSTLRREAYRRTLADFVLKFDIWLTIVLIGAGTLLYWGDSQVHYATTNLLLHYFSSSPHLYLILLSVIIVLYVALPISIHSFVRYKRLKKKKT